MALSKKTLYTDDGDGLTRHDNISSGTIKHCTKCIPPYVPNTKTKVKIFVSVWFPGLFKMGKSGKNSVSFTANTRDVEERFIIRN